VVKFYKVIFLLKGQKFDSRPKGHQAEETKEGHGALSLEPFLEDLELLP